MAQRLRIFLLCGVIGVEAAVLTVIYWASLESRTPLASRHHSDATPTPISREKLPKPASRFEPPGKASWPE